MKKIITLACALSLVGLSGASAQVIFKTINETELDLGYMTVRQLPDDGGAKVSQSAWPIADLNAVFPTGDSVVFSPNTIANTGTNWYTPGTGGIGAAGNRNMNAYLYGEATGTLSGALEFSGLVSSFSLATNIAGFPYTLQAVIKDFAPNYTSVVETFLPITSTGIFTHSQSLQAGPDRIVQWGLLMTGPNIWPSDAEQLELAGSVTIQAVPEPSTYALLGLVAVGCLFIRQLRRRA